MCDWVLMPLLQRPLHGDAFFGLINHDKVSVVNEKRQAGNQRREITPKSRLLDITAQSGSYTYPSSVASCLWDVGWGAWGRKGGTLRSHRDPRRETRCKGQPSPRGQHQFMQFLPILWLSKGRGSYSHLLALSCFSPNPHPQEAGESPLKEICESPNVGSAEAIWNS